MNALNNKYFIIRKILGLVIVFHGLYRIVTILNYVDFVSQHLSGIITNQTVLVVRTTLLPFLEFLSGALLFMKVGVKRSAFFATIISIIMVVFIIIGDLGIIRLLYHFLVLVGLAYIIYAYRPLILNERNFNISKSKINSRE
ncbi:hypothetical protein ULMS_23680 [Patiriisocius marinistellae]|uniref:DoxX family protein n=1 Tax=Patiriisocius marinistellae TaxID=2494560 RepID=A0A5J4FX88_9FLAO|nr:hypothetical protein [Patiriisocius marinistellae]GEQ86860.1 hypothetical protein ULMS_23680 [Patiriisocius marinistellae]